MSELNFTRKTFLEREELNRFQEFLRDNTVTNAILDNTTQYGIIQTEFTTADTNFQVTMGTNTGTIQFAKERSQAIDIDGRLIRLLATNNIPVTNDANWYWVRISFEFRRHELGTVSLNANGQLTGTGTLFTETLRGQATDVPVNVRFLEQDGTAPTNNGIYEVVNVIDDTNALLTSTTGFTAENNLNMIVIGATPIGEIVSTEQLTGIYQYDSCLVELVLETVVNTPPALPPNGANRYFYVARVQNSSNVITIQDQRDIDETYWKFAVPGIEGAVLTRFIPPPTAVGDYMFLGSIPNNITGYVRLFVQGAGQSIGDVLDIRISNFDLGVSFFQDITTNVIFGGAATDLRPTVLRVNNTTTNRLEIYLRAGTADSGAIFIPGYVSFIGQNIAGNADGWEYADNFTWSSSAPSGAITGTVRFAVYGGAGIINNLDTTLTTINSNLASNSTSIQELQADTGWLDCTATTNVQPGSIRRARQIGKVVTLQFLFGRVDPSPGGGAVIMFGLPNTISAPNLNLAGSPSFRFIVSELAATASTTLTMSIDTSGLIRISDIDDMTTLNYSGTVTYLVD